MRSRRFLEGVLGTLLLATIPSTASAQQDIASELEALKAQFASAKIMSLPSQWTGGLEGLSFVFTFDTPLPGERGVVTDEQRSAARSICRKIGAATLKKNRAKPGLEDLRFFVVELRTRKPVFGMISTVGKIGLVFDADKDCSELR